MTAPARQFVRSQEPVLSLHRRLGGSLDTMVAIQMEAAPGHWTEDEKREWAERLLFGEGR